MFTKKLEDQFSADLLNTVKGILDEAKKHEKDCECKKCEDEEEDDDEDETKKEGYMPTNDMPSDKDRKVAGKLGAMLKREREAKEKKEPLGVKTEETSGKQHIEVTHITGEKSKKPVHPDNAFKALNHYKSLSTTKSARIVSEEVEEIEEKTGLWDNIHAKRKRIKAGSGERMRKPGSKGAPTNADFKAASEEVEQMHEEKHPIVKEYDSLKKHDIKTLRGMISQQNKVVDTSEFKTKDHAISHYLRNKHGNKKVDTAFGFKEEVQLDELSKSTMGRYINKAATKMGSQGVTAGLKIAADKKSSKNFKDMAKREKGIKLAVNKLTKEEQEFIDTLNVDTLEEGRGRPPKEGSAAWHAKMKQDNDDMPALGVQLRKAKSMNKKVRFMDGKEHEIHPNHADRFEDHMDARKTTQDKAAFQKQAHKSHADFVKAVTAPVPKTSKGTGEIVKYRH